MPGGTITETDTAPGADERPRTLGERGHYRTQLPEGHVHNGLGAWGFGGRKPQHGLEVRCGFPSTLGVSKTERKETRMHADTAVLKSILVESCLERILRVEDFERVEMRIPLTLDTLPLAPLPHGWPD